MTVDFSTSKKMPMVHYKYKQQMYKTILKANTITIHRYIHKISVSTYTAKSTMKY